MVESAPEARQAPVPRRNELVREWDRLAETRHRQITSGIDTSYGLVSSTAMSLLPTAQGAEWLDVGCGTGDLTARIVTALGVDVLGIDPSPKSIEIAKREYARIDGTAFEECFVEDFACRENAQGAYEVVVANMVLMDVVDLSSVVQSIASVLSPDGCLVFSITHPWFWPRYWGYEEEEWFEYKEEVFVKARFQVSKESTPFFSTHVHRPLESYVQELHRQGLLLDQLLEPATHVASKGTMDQGQYPRYLVGRAMRVSGLQRSRSEL